MRFTTKQRLIRAFVASTIMFGIISVAAPTSAAPPVSVDFTVHETLPLASPGDLLISNIPNCPAALGSVISSPVTVTTTGPRTHFSGTKVFDCGNGNSFTLEYRASTSECRSTDRGKWKLIDGSGIFAGAKGHGRIVGTYTLGDGTGTFCDNDGIDDHYTGRIKL